MTHGDRCFLDPTFPYKPQQSLQVIRGLILQILFGFYGVEPRVTPTPASFPQTEIPQKKDRMVVNLAPVQANSGSNTKPEAVGSPSW